MVCLQEVWEEWIIKNLKLKKKPLERGVFWYNAAMDNNAVRQGYNQIAEAYLKNRDQFKNQKYLDKLIALLPKGSTILDIGCGAGMPIDLYLVQHGYKIIGIDISEKQIELAKANVPQGDFSVRDMSTLKKREFTVDAVISFYAIFHISREQHIALFGKIKSFLSPGGLLLVTMGSSDWVGSEDFYGTEMSWSHYDATMNKQIVESAGFSILESEIDTSGGEKHLVILAKEK